MFISAYKEIGETPLQCLERYRLEKGIDKTVSMTYAGRLDPLAHGLLPLLAGDLVHKKNWFTSLDKTYEVEVLLSVATDTYDIFGMPIIPRVKNTENEMSGFDVYKTQEFKKITEEFIGNIEQEYPPFSSKPIDGTPMWQYARDGRMNEIKDRIPKHTIFIRSIEVINPRAQKSTPTPSPSISTEALLQKLEKIITATQDGGYDFRQEKILAAWRDVKEKSKERGGSFKVISLQVSCGGGAYIRQVIHDISKRIGIGMCIYDLKRVRVGPFLLNSVVKDSFEFE